MACSLCQSSTYSAEEGSLSGNNGRFQPQGMLHALRRLEKALWITEKARAPLYIASLPTQTYVVEACNGQVASLSAAAQEEKLLPPHEYDRLLM